MTTIPASGAALDRPLASSHTGGGLASAANPMSAGARHTAPLDAAALLQELAEFAGSMGTTGDTGAAGDPAVGPPLPAAARSFSGDEMIALLRTLQEKSQTTRLESAKKNIETSQVQADQNHKMQLEKINEWIKKCEEANRGGLLGKIFGWIGKIAAFVASLVAVVALSAGSVVTGGAATPLLAMAVVGLVASGIALADQVSQELGGPQISIGNLLATVMGKLLQALGVSEEVAEKIGKTLAGATALLMPAMLLVEPSLLGDLLTGICGLAGVDEKTLGIINMVATLVASLAVSIALIAVTGGASAGATVGRIAQAAGQITAGASKVAEGATGIVTAKQQAAADKALADRKKLAALMLELQKNMEDEREEVQKIIMEIQEGVQAVTRMINDISDSMTQVTQNLRGQAAV